MRDPRKDPRPGDVLQKKFQGQYFESRGYYSREVFDIDGAKVTYVGVNVCAPTITLNAWRRWAKNADIVQQAQI